MNLNHLYKQTALLLAAVREQEEAQALRGLVIYDPETGEPCPGYEEAAAQPGVQVWLTRKGRLPNES